MLFLSQQFHLLHLLLLSLTNHRITILEHKTIQRNFFIKDEFIMQFLPPSMLILVTVDVKTQEIWSLQNPALLCGSCIAVFIQDLKIQRLIYCRVKVLVFNINVEHVHDLLSACHCLEIWLNCSDHIDFYTVEQSLKPMNIICFFLLI